MLPTLVPTGPTSPRSQQTQTRRIEARQVVPAPSLPATPCPASKKRTGSAAFLSSAGIRGAGGARRGRTRSRTASRHRTWRLAPHSPRTGREKRRLPPITASTASGQVPALASKLAAQTPHTHWKVGPGPGPGPAPGIRRVSQGLGGGGGWEAISPPAPLRLWAAIATAG